jgi:hypothetical protein
MNRHLKKHIEMERLFGADFLPVSRSALAAKVAEPEKREEKAKLDWKKMRGETP